jgi:transcriptional regulator
MYIHPKCADASDAEVFAAMREFPFATLVTTDADGRLVASHIPLEATQDEEGTLVLFGHVAKRNPQWRVLDPAREVLVIFNGPNAYISPRWYHRPTAPTWNYIAIQVRGRVEMLDDVEAVRGIVTRQIEIHERAAEPFTIAGVPSGELEVDLRAIVGVRITATSIQAGFKLSQPSDDSEYANLIAQLSEGTLIDRATAEVMRKRRMSQKQ